VTARDLTFLSPPGEIADWRMILLCDAAGAVGLFDALPGTVEGLAARLSLDPHVVRVELDALAALGVVERTGGGLTYAATAATPDATTMATIRHHARALRRWVASVEKRLRGEAVDTGGVDDPEAFHDSLAATARTTAPVVVDTVLARFPDARSVLDLGGLHGEYSLEFARRGLKAVMQDMPAMIDVARRRGRLEAAGIELYEGSFFDSVPSGPFDIAFCSGITHTFDADGNRALYRNLRPAVAPDGGGGVAVITFLRHRNPITALFAVQMMVNANGGDTHTEAEYRQWLTEAGFTVDEAIHDLPDQGGRSVLFAT